MKTKLFTLFLSLIAGMGTIFADAVQIGDLYYNLDATAKTAEVTYKNRFDKTNYADLTSVTIPQTVSYKSTTYSVNRIGELAFVHCPRLTKVVMQQGIKKIGNSAFSGCTSLSSVSIPASVEEIGVTAFYDCSVLCQITLPANLKAIANGTFMKCLMLEEVEIPASVTRIGVTAFWGCLSLRKIVLKNAVSEIGENAFQGCSNLKKVTLGANIKSIDSDAFIDCVNITEVHIISLKNWCGIAFATEKSNPLYCAKHLFLDGSEISALAVPADVETISANAFYGGSFTSVTIPHQVKKIMDDAFAECKITAIYTDDLSHWCNIHFATDKSNPLSASCGLYVNNSPVTELTLPNEIDSVSQYAFTGDVLLQKVTIPNHIKKIADGAFGECTRLDTVLVESADVTCTVGSGVFPYRSKIVVPCGSLEKYLTTGNWKNYNMATIHPYEITCTMNIPDAGKITIIQDCENVKLSVEAKENFEFVKWSDGVTDAERTIVLTEDLALEAEFIDLREGLDEIKADKLTHKLFRNGCLYICRGGEIYTVQGTRVE